MPPAARTSVTSVCWWPAGAGAQPRARRPARDGSPLNSFVGLTRPAPGVDPSLLAALYPTGRRSYLRVFPTDDLQGAALALLARDRDRRDVFVLLVRSAGSAARGASISLPGVVTKRLPPAGAAFVHRFGRAQAGDEIEPSAVYAAQAAQVVLDAFARSDGTRSSIVDELFRTRVRDGLLGDFRSTGAATSPGARSRSCGSRAAARRGASRASRAASWSASRPRAALVAGRR